MVKLFVIFSVLLAFAGIVTVLGQAPVTPGTPQACAGAVTILINGQPLSNPVTGCVLNLQAGSGVTAAALPDPAIGGTDINFSLNTSFAPSFSQLQQDPLFCNSTDATPEYNCSLAANGQALQGPPAGPGYRQGLELLLLVATTCATTCSLNVDHVGMTTIDQADGMTAPNGELIAGQARHVWFDGTVFRLE
jgi:hypothetical protein